MSALGHSRPGPAGRRSSHVRYAPKATVGHQNAIGRDGPRTDIRAPFSITELLKKSGSALSRALPPEGSSRKAPYPPSWSLIISWTFFFTASRLKEAGSCIGG